MHFIELQRMPVFLYVQDKGLSETLSQFLYSDVRLINDKDQADFVLDVSDTLYLTCTIDAFASFLEWALVMDSFDTIFLNDFCDNAVILRAVPNGMANFLVKPSVFTKRIGHASHKKQIILHDKGSYNKEIKLGALVFFLIAFAGVTIYCIYSAKKKKSIISGI